MKARGFFITGTDTGVGKTWVTTHWLRHLRQAGIDAVGMKPVECGGREDATAIHEACDRIATLDEINPVSLPEPLAPAAIPGAPCIAFDEILANFNLLSLLHFPVLVEGAGGWLVPIDRDRTMADLAVALGLPVIVVAANRLGVLNHTLLTVRAIEASGLVCRAVFLNDLDEWTKPDDLSRESNARVLRDHLPGIPVIERDPAALLDLI
ncbi:MAG: dethiobiotin synthase [Verrucomicrobiales bacterium]|nr:dethiobiotin synthase [Verrucomicrobiales bacterium]